MGNGHGEKASRNKEIAIAALISCPTVRAAAKKIGVAMETLRRWMKDEDFQTEYQAARRQLVDDAVLKLQKTTSLAIETLASVMKSKYSKEASKVAAARTVLENAMKSVGVKTTDNDGDAGTITGSFSARLPMNPTEALLKLAKRINQAQAAAAKPPAKRRASDGDSEGK